MIKKIIKKILSWFGPKYIEVVYQDPVSFEMDQLIKKHKKQIPIKKTLTYTKKKFDK